MTRIGVMWRAVCLLSCIALLSCMALPGCVPAASSEERQTPQSAAEAEPTGPEPSGRESSDPEPSGPSERHRRLLTTFMDEFIEITPGSKPYPATFTMGSDSGTPAETPPHEERMSGRFWVARYEVPQNLYAAVMGENPSRWQGPRNSAERMTWHEAREFCRRITRRLHAAELLPERDEIRLPTETEWEYVCRAGTTTAYSFGDRAQEPDDVAPRASVLDAYAWHTGNAAGNDPAVGSLKPNPWGLYDVHGYLWEYTADAWREDYRKPREAGADQTTAIVIRGGSWRDEFPALRSAMRRQYRVTDRSDAVGFRCVRARISRVESSTD